MVGGCSKFGLRAIDGVRAAVLTQSRHWRRSTLRYKIYVTLLLRRVIPPPVGIWLQPGSCAQYKFLALGILVLICKLLTSNVNV